MLGWVFGYGSLAALAVPPDRGRGPAGFVADLRGFTRGWGVAMDNARDLPGYKCYLDPAGGRPRVHVAFLDLAEAPGGRVNGVCRPVDAAELRRLDARERNYARVEVGARIGGGAPAEPVWTYVGTVAGRARLAAGRAAGDAVIHAGYLAAVRRSFRALGTTEWAQAAPSLDPGGLPVRDLVRRELP